MVWCSTVDEQSDLNTKALPTKQFRFLRDNLNGYGLVMLHYPDVPMPEAAIERDELIEMIQEYDNADVCWGVHAVFQLSAIVARFTALA